MFKNKNGGRNNLCGIKIQLIGIDVDKNAVQIIESGKRFVTDIELKAFSKIFVVSTGELI